MPCCKVWSTRGLVNLNRAAPLLWACDRVELHSDRQKYNCKEWQKVMAGEFSLWEPYTLYCGHRCAVTADECWWAGHERRWHPCHIQMCRQLGREMVCMSPLVSCPGFCNDQQLLWRKNNSGGGEWRTTRGAESTCTTDKPLGIATGDWLILEHCFLETVREQCWFRVLLLSRSAFDSFQQLSGTSSAILREILKLCVRNVKDSIAPVNGLFLGNRSDCMCKKPRNSSFWRQTIMRWFIPVFCNITDPYY